MLRLDLPGQKNHQYHRSFKNLRGADDSEGRQPQRPQAKVQQPLIDITVRQKLPKGSAKIGQVAMPIKSFEETHTAANLEALRPGEFARIVIVKQHDIRVEFFAQENRADFSSAESVLFLDRRQVGFILKLLYFDPFGIRNLRCPWKSGTRDDHFVVNLGGDIKARNECIEKVEAAQLCQNNQRR
jgi:hypothetical protein